MSNGIIQNELYHHGIIGQKWGVRRYQNADGSLTPKGKARLAKDVDSLSKKDYSKDAYSFHRKVNSMPSVKQFNKEHKKRS